jgi:hypothetical protein
MSVHPPSQFIANNLGARFTRLNFTRFMWVIIVLQQARYELVEITPEVGARKSACGKVCASVLMSPFL